MSEVNTAPLFENLKLLSHKSLKNRFMLAPLTNMQSHDDGTLSDDEYRWLTMRSEGGFALTMTCAAYVQKIGKGFPGQLGVYSDKHLPGMTKLATKINAEQSLSIVQLHHAGVRTPKNLTNELPVCPSDFDDGELVARGLSNSEVKDTIEAFIQAAVRSENAGFNGVEIHGAHGYLLTQFLSKEYNKRTDEYGGSFENRVRIFFEIIDGIKNRCAPDFVIGVRLSPELWGLELSEVLKLAQQLIDIGTVDFLDISLWDVYKKPDDDTFASKLLIELFTDLHWHQTKLVVAGKIQTSKDALWCLDKGADFVALGKMSILHHDYPNRLKQNSTFIPNELPVTKDYLRSEGLNETFTDYMATRWKGFIQE